LGRPGSCVRLARLSAPAFFWWWFSFDAYAPAIFQTGAFIAASGGFVSIAVAIGMSVWRARELKNAETYGSARWATERGGARSRVARAERRGARQARRDYLRHDGPEHVLCFAPTRSGKGVGLVVPSLLTWPASAIVHDIKGENWTLTAGFRSRHGRVLLFDPTNAASAAYNPLLEVRRGQWEVRDVQNVADVLVDPKAASSVGTTGRKPRTRCWSARSSMSSMPSRQDGGRRRFLSDPSRSSRRWPR
jgi:type IV secretion system protein VirD4